MDAAKRWRRQATLERDELGRTVSVIVSGAKQSKDRDASRLRGPTSSRLSYTFAVTHVDSRVDKRLDLWIASLARNDGQATNDSAKTHRALAASAARSGW